MNTQEILSILRGERGINPNMGIEEDDLLANGFFDLPSGEHDAFWLALSTAMKTLVANNEGVPIYLASRFIFRMSEIEPSRTPRKRSLFDFLLDIPADGVPPARLAGTLLTLLVLKLNKKGNAEFWKRQITASLNSLEAKQDDHYAMAAVVYAFLGYNRLVSIPAEDWTQLFVTLSRLPRLPRMELLELLVGVEKEQTRDPCSLEKEISNGLDEYIISASDKQSAVLSEHLSPVLRAWLDRNAPHEVVAEWLRGKLRPQTIQIASPRARAVALTANAHRAVA